MFSRLLLLIVLILAAAITGTLIFHQQASSGLKVEKVELP